MGLEQKFEEISADEEIKAVVGIMLVGFVQMYAVVSVEIAVNELFHE